MARRRVRRLFGWERVPDPTTFGPWLRRTGDLLVPMIDRLLGRLVRRRWKRRGVPETLTLALDSTVVVRYGTRQAGAEVGYNPKKPGRPSHHPLLAFAVATGDLIGLLWRPGSAWSGARTEQWVPELIGWRREVGVSEITLRLDKGFWKKEIVRTLQALDVHFLLKAPNQAYVRQALATWRSSKRATDIFPRAAEVYSNSDRLWGARLLSLEGRRSLEEVDGTLDLDTHEVTETAHVLTNIPGIHALTAWRHYNAGCVVEQRIEELKQLSVGQTAIDDLDGNRLLRALGGLAYQLVVRRPAQAAAGLALPHTRPMDEPQRPVAARRAAHGARPGPLRSGAERAPWTAPLCSLSELRPALSEPGASRAPGRRSSRTVSTPGHGASDRPNPGSRDPVQVPIARYSLHRRSIDTISLELQDSG